MSIPGVVLAAGRSSRMGAPKALLPLPTGERFGSRVVRTLLGAGIAPVIVVARPDDAALADALAGHPAGSVRVVVNPTPERGQLSSLQQGLAAAGPSAPAAVVTLVDVPMWSPQTVERLVACWRSTGAPLVRPARGARHGHPIVVARPAIDELCRADLSLTARDVLQRFLPDAQDVAVADQYAFQDVDTPDDYARLMDRLRTGRDSAP